MQPVHSLSPLEGRPHALVSLRESTPREILKKRGASRRSRKPVHWMARTGCKPPAVATLKPRLPPSPPLLGVPSRGPTAGAPQEEGRMPEILEKGAPFGEKCRGPQGRLHRPPLGLDGSARGQTPCPRDPPAPSSSLPAIFPGSFPDQNGRTGICRRPLMRAAGCAPED